MTNRSKSNKGRIRCMNLTFQPQTNDGVPAPGHSTSSNNDVLNNGFRPHGGNRGSKKHPKSQFSYTKSAEYHRKLRDDIDKLFDEEEKEKHQTPTWVHEVTKETSHSGESPLFSNKHLSPSKQEQHMEYVRLAHALLEENRSKLSSRSCTTMPAYHRANSAHQYMEATDLPVSDLDSKLGRPTRTTLLRNRQRTASAPLSSYEIRKEAKKKAQEILDQRSRPTTAAAHKEILFMPSVEKGDTAHAFLTGARYNRAHYLDSKSLTKYGVYMPRDNPLGAFVNPKLKTEIHAETAAAPPSPADTPIPEKMDSRPCTPVQRPGAQKGRQAWGESSMVPDVKTNRGNVPEASKSTEFAPADPTGLNITGHRLGGISAPSNTPRVRSACSSGRQPYTPKSDFSIPPRDLPPSRGLPVCVGKSIYGMPFTPEALRHMAMANQPRASPVISARDVAEKMNVDILNIEAEMNGLNLDEKGAGERLPVRDEIIKEETEVSYREDVTNRTEDGKDLTNGEVDADEVANDDRADDDTANQDEAAGDAANQDQEEGDLTNQNGKVQETTDENLEVESCGHEEQEQIPDDNVEFFLTEEGGEKFVNCNGAVGEEEEGEIDAEAVMEGEGDQEVAESQGHVLNGEEDRVSVAGSELSDAASGQETARETFAPVISVDISRKSTENLQTMQDETGDH